MIKEYKTKEGVFYSVRVFKTNSFGKKIEKSKRNIKTYPQAQKEARRLSEELIRQIVQDESKGVSWGMLVEKWELGLRNNQSLNRPIGRTTSEDYVRALQLYTSHWNSRAAEDITRADVKDVLLEMKEMGKSKSRERALVTSINSIFRWGVDNRFLKPHVSSPAIGVKVNYKEEKKPEILSLEQIQKLLLYAKTQKHEYFYVWAVALHTGCRSGELLALEWSDVDLEAQRLVVSKTFNKRLNVIKPPKSGEWREVPINDELKKLLSELKLCSNGRKHVLPRITSWLRGEAARVLRSFCVGYGLPSIKFHALRACFATQLLRGGVAPAVVMKICGWKDLKTMQRYIRLAGIETDGATQTLQLLSPETSTGKLIEIGSVF